MNEATFLDLRRSLGLVAAGLALALAGCSATPPRPEPGPTARPGDGGASAQTPAARRGGGYYKDDGPGENPPPDLDLIPDAEPRDEPLHRYANRPYNVFGQDYFPATQRRAFRERGTASWYGRKFHGKPTSSGEPYDMYGMTAAHPTLPIPSYVRVTNVGNGRSTVVRVNDRGPFHRGRVIDLSYAAAHRLGYVNSGSATVELEAILPDEVDLVARAEPVPPLPGRKAAPLQVPPDVAAPPAAAPAMAMPASPASAPSPGVFLQLGAFSSLDKAEGFRGMVRQELAMFADRLELLNDGARVRLHLGPFASADEARAEADRIADVLKLRPFVVLR